MSLLHDQLRAIDRVAILGTGLLGGSIGLGLKAAGWAGEVIGHSRRQATLEAAVAQGCIDRMTTDLADAVGSAQLLIVCTPVGIFPDMFRRIAAYDHDQLVVTDVGSTKREVCDAARMLLPVPSRFVGSHPMAGGEQHGPTYARADLFANKVCIVCPEDDKDANAVALVDDLWRTLGMNVVHMNADRADDDVARISHLPHAAAVLLVKLAARLGGMHVASTGFRDTTRVASGDPQIWVDIFESNRESTIAAIDAFTEDLTAFRKLLENNDTNAMASLLEVTKRQRDDWLATFETKPHCDDIQDTT